jgi:flagellar biosynthesis protein FlhF
VDIKRFIGPDMRSALRLVREQLGPDAVILSNRRVAQGIEITAGPGEDFGAPAASAVELPIREAVPARGSVSQERASAPAAAPAQAVRPAASSPSSVAGEPVLSAVQGEIRDLRAVLERGLGAIRGERLGWDPGLEGRAWRHLTRAGLPNDVVQSLMDVLRPGMDWDGAIRALRMGLSGGIGCTGDLVSAGGVFAAIGPTGAGKTTTLCKLAVRHALTRGTEGLVLASLDTARLGGPDMLRAVARLLQVPFLAAGEGEDAAALVARAGDCRLLLLDTPGLSRRRPEEAMRVNALSAAGVRCLLVLPANAQFAWLESAMADHREACAVAAVVTKLDECVSLGEALGALWRARLPLAYTTNGQEIPDDLDVAEADALSALALSAGDEEQAAALRAAPIPRAAAAMGIGARIA